MEKINKVLFTTDQRTDGLRLECITSVIEHYHL